MRKAFTLSLVAHLCVALYLFHAGQMKSHSLYDHQQAQTLETRTLSLDEFNKEFKERSKDSPQEKLNTRKQIIQADDQLKSLEAPSAHQESFLARHNQRFDKNTRAARIGDFKNVLKEGVKTQDLFKLSDSKAQAPQPEQTLETQKGKTLSFAPTANTKQREPASHEKQSSEGDGFSATDDYLPHIAIGANTLLNTREYIYASFFERIREKLNQHWRQLIQHEMEQLYIQGVRNIEGERSTKLRIQIDPNGKLVNIKKYGSTGYLELDRAALNAFEAAAPFVNPPQGLIEQPDNLVSIDWHFVIVGGTHTGVQMRVHRHPASF